MRTKPIPRDWLSAAFLNRYIAPRLRLTEDGCLVWTGATNRNGYGVFAHRIGNRIELFKVHRIVYTALEGPIPEGLVLDHDQPGWGCHNPACVLHVRPVTIVENNRRRRPKKANVSGERPDPGGQGTRVEHLGRGEAGGTQSSPAGHLPGPPT